MKNVIAFSILFLSIIASAAPNRAEQMAHDNPNMTPYQTLQKLFNESAMPAHLSDIDLATDNNSNQRCAVAHEDSTSEPIVKVFVQRWSYSYPSQGPLFPTNTKEFIEVNSVSRTVNEQFISTFADHTTVSQTGRELIVYVDGNFQMTGANPLQYKLRKNNDLIVIEITSEIGLLNARVSYAYCYRTTGDH
jgi:hypothetical protein